MALLVAFALVGAPADATGNGYTVYIACSAAPNAKPATECLASQTPVAVFRSARHDATYRVCVKFPHKKKRLCAAGQDAEKGEKTSVTIATSVLGRHVVTWYVAGEVVGKRAFRNVVDRPHLK